MLVSMSEGADMPRLNWSDLGVSELLPTGTVTLLLADVEGSTRLWQTQHQEMTAAIGTLGRTATPTAFRASTIPGTSRSTRRWRPRDGWR